jgi:hypothetical protein
MWQVPNEAIPVLVGDDKRIHVMHWRVINGQYFLVPPQFLQDWLESCRNPQDSAGLQAKVFIFVASPAKLGRAQQNLAGLGKAWQDWTGFRQSFAGFILN